MGTNSNKIKLLKIWELLSKNTDEQKPISRRDLVHAITRSGIPCDIRTLSKDINVLNQYGFEVMIQKRDHEKFYYVADRSFSIPELRIMIDSVQASCFITEKKTNELTQKIATLGGSYSSDILQQGTVHFNHCKHSNEQVFYAVDVIERAIREHSQVGFKYFDLNEHGERVLRKGEKLYLAEPIALVLNEAYYYLLAYSAKYDGVTTYRIDRMESVTMVDQDVSEKALSYRDKVPELMESSFRMYHGKEETVTLSFDNSLIGTVFDRFGEKTEMHRVDENTLTVTVRVKVSPTFWGWLFQFGGKMQITEPGRVREEGIAYLQNLAGSMNLNVVADAEDDGAEDTTAE